MTPPSEDLRELWQSDSGSGGVDQRELWLRLEQKTRKFDRTIRWRDIREIVAGLFVAIFFLWLGTQAGSTLGRVAHFWLSAYGVWVVFFLLRYSKSSREPAPDHALAVYRSKLLERYDRQIWLLKNAKYWYVLPLWIGLMLTSIAYPPKGGKTGLMMFVVSGVCALVWVVNSVIGVRRVQRKRQELVRLIGEEE